MSPCNQTSQKLLERQCPKHMYRWLKIKLPTINASARPSAVAASLKPPPANCMDESQCKKISTSLVQPLLCTKQPKKTEIIRIKWKKKNAQYKCQCVYLEYVPQYEPWELKMTSDSSTLETGFLCKFRGYVKDSSTIELDKTNCVLALSFCRNDL